MRKPTRLNTMIAPTGLLVAFALLLPSLANAAATPDSATGTLSVPRASAPWPAITGESTGIFTSLIVPQADSGNVLPAVPLAQPATGITTDDGVNMRTGAGTDYKIVAQLPANTRVQVLAQQDNWYQIHTSWQTDGWVSADYLKMVQQPALQGLGTASAVGTVNLRSGAGTNFPVIERLPDGAVLDVLSLQGDWYKVVSPLGTTGWVAADYAPLDWIPDAYGGGGAPASAASSDVVSIAQKYLGARYVWGGSNPNGFDCSGFTWYVYKRVGVRLPAGTWAQFSSRYGRYIGDINSLSPGDLVFFERTTDDGGVTHVGLYAGGGKMIAARSERLGVRYVSLRDPFWSSRFLGGIRPYR